jgi:hypothetical protein
MILEKSENTLMNLKTIYDKATFATFEIDDNYDQPI